MCWCDPQKRTPICDTCPPEKKAEWPQYQEGVAARFCDSPELPRHLRRSRPLHCAFCHKDQAIQDRVEAPHQACDLLIRTLEIERNHAAAELARTQAQLDAAVAGLKVYASKDSWHGREQENMWDIYWLASNADGYDIAVEALKKIKEATGD
jgi:hypothetical protein